MMNDSFMSSELRIRLNKMKPHLADDTDDLFRAADHHDGAAAYKKVIDDLTNSDTRYASRKILSSNQSKAVIIMLTKRFGYTSVEIMSDVFPWCHRIQIKVEGITLPHIIAKNIFTHFKWGCSCGTWLMSQECKELDRIQGALDAIFG